MSRFYDLLPFTLLDFPDEMACIVWFAGCNMRCIYCHNPEIVMGKNMREEEEFFSFLEKRKGRLTGVVFSGGEATLNPDLPAIMEKTKAMGFKIKLDTNGTRPAVLKDLVARGLLDYVALDFKAPREKLAAITGSDKYWDDFRESLRFLIAQSSGDSAVCDSKTSLSDPSSPSSPQKSSLSFEIRTTIHPDKLEESDVAAMIEDLEALGYHGVYYLQNVASTGDTTLGKIEKATRSFDLSQLPVPTSFKLATRNF